MRDPNELGLISAGDGTVLSFRRAEARGSEEVPKHPRENALDQDEALFLN